MPTELVHLGAIVSPPWLGAFVWTFVGSCLRTEAQRRNIALSKLVALNVEEQAAQVGQLLALGVHAIVIKPMGGLDSSLRDALDRAHAAGVPVVTLDSSLDHVAVISTVGTDNAAAMAQATRFVFERIKGVGKVAYFAGDNRLPSGALRNTSFHQVLSEHPRIELVHEAQLDWASPMPRRAFGAECMRTALAAGERVDALISASDEPALGALDHCRDEHVAVPFIMGFDGIPEALLEVSAGGLGGTMLQSAEHIARSALDQMVHAVAGEPVQRLVPIGTTLITTDNAEQAALGSLQLLPRLIFDLSEVHATQRELQQEIILRQRRILAAVAAASDALSRFRQIDPMVSDLVKVLTEHFDLTSARFVPATSDMVRLLPRYEACVNSRKAILLHDIPDLGDAVDSAVLLLPLYVADKPVGLLDLRSRHTRNFNAESVDILVAIAHQLAVAVENASLYEETVRLAQKELAETHEKLALAQRAEHLSNHDGLTDLPNRRLFSTLLDQAVLQARRYDKKLAVMFLDLDRFKVINDTMGHEAGDQLLKEAALRLKRCLRESDTAARLGGDEFVVLVPEITDATRLAGVASKIITVISEPFPLGGHDFRVTASIGIALFPEDGGEGGTLIKNADIAMYQAKRQGKNNFQYYSDQINRHSLERVALEASLRKALAQGEFRLHYQPKRDTLTERITGVEALLRWQHPELGLIGPVDFLPVAEEMGLSVAMGRWVIDAACSQYVAWQRLGLPPLVVSVNLTPKQLTDAGLVDMIEAALAATGMSAAFLELEVSEGTLMHDADRCINILSALKRCGVRLAVDNFGSGYSSLAALKRFPLDTVKIDRSFIRGVASGESDMSVAQAIIAMGRTLSLTIVAQGVETQQQADFLRTHACQECQGFYFNAAMASDDVTTLLKRQVQANSQG